MQTLQQLLTLPEFAADFGPERLQKLEHALAADRRSDMPWYLRFFVALGAWLASAFFIGFALAMTGFDVQHRLGLGITGLVLLVASTILVRLKLGLFANQCCLAASLAGQFLIYYGFLPEQHNTMVWAVILSIGLAAALYWAYPDMVQRLITCVAALQITLAWIYLGNDGEGQAAGILGFEALLTLYWVIHLGAIACCFLAVTRGLARLTPLGYAVIISLAAWQLANFNGFLLHYATARMETSSQAPIFWPYYIRLVCTALMLFGVVVWAAGGSESLSRFALPYAGLACALIAIIWLGVGGIVLPLLLIVLGFFIESTVILGMGLILLPVFLSRYYYYLHLDLLAKSVALAGTGAALLLLRTGLRQWLPLEFKEVS